MPASYPANGTGPEGLTAEIVDCGTGFAEDYEGKDVEGKIALVAMDWEEGWIDNFTNEAWLHGAAADRAARQKGEYGMLPQDIFAHLGQMFAENDR